MRHQRAEVVCCGLDLSLLESGLCAIPSDWGGDWTRVRTLHHSSDPLVNQNEAEKMQRVDRIVQAVLSFVLTSVPMGVKMRIAIENYAYDQFKGVTLAEVGGPVKLELYRAGYIVQPVMMQTARLQMVGSIRKKENRAPEERTMAIKDVVRMRATRMGMPRSWSLDVGDAFVAANYLLLDYPGAALVAPRPAEDPAGKKLGRKNRPSA